MRKFGNTLGGAFKKHLWLNIVRLVLSLAIAVILANALVKGSPNRVFYCPLTFVLFFAPDAVRRFLRVDIPDPLAIVFLLLLFSANMLGELLELYISIPIWDSVLHLVSGFFLALAGYFLVDLQNGGAGLPCKPLFLAFTGLCCAITFGVAWEFFEFFMDNDFGTDMQKDAYISSITSILLDPRGRNTAVTEVIDSVVINGRPWPGYIDIGLIDTMVDMLMATAGSLVASVFVFFHEKSGRVFRFIELFRIRRL